MSRFSVQPCVLPDTHTLQIQMVLLSPNNCKTYFDGIPWTNDITKKTYTIRYNWSKNNLFCMRDAGKGGRVG